MNSILSFIVSYLVNSVWEVALLAGAGWLVSRLLRRLGPRMEHRVWVFTLVLAVLTPAIPLFRWLLALLYVPRGASSHASIAFISAQNGGANLGGVYALRTIFVVLLLSAYLGSLLYFAMRLAWSLHRTMMLLRNAAPFSLTLEQNEIWRHCKQMFSLDTARILSSSEISGPVTLGLWEPVLLIPAEFVASCTSHDFLAALAHECAHMKRHDFQKNLLYEAVSLVLAFHPVIWMLKSRIAQTREMVCDGMATEKIIDRRNYTQSLLRLASMVAVTSRVSTTHAIGIFDANILEKRIMMMNVRKQHLSSALKYGLMVPAALLLLSAAVGGAAMAVVIEPQAASQTYDKAQPYGQVYHIGNGVSTPVLVYEAEPQFSEEARKAKFSGIVMVNLLVDTEGKPSHVHVTRGVGMGLDEKAVEAVKQYRFNPAMKKNKPVVVEMNIEVNFKTY